MLFVSFLRHSPSHFPEGNLVPCIYLVRTMLWCYGNVVMVMVLYTSINLVLGSGQLAGSEGVTLSYDAKLSCAHERSETVANF